MFSLSGLLATSTRPTLTKKMGSPHKTSRLKDNKGKKKKSHPKLSSCLGIALNLIERYPGSIPVYPSHYGYACSMRCRHPIHTGRERRSLSRYKSDEWIHEDIYKRYTDTDSRPLTPEITRRSGHRGVSVSGDSRKCFTPEPEARQCQFHHRRVLILDLRRVKSVDAITRQDSRTTGTSGDSTYGDDEVDDHSHQDSSSIFCRFSPQNMSLSRSITPKTKINKGLKKKTKERSSSPIVYERSTSPKILEGKLRRHGRNRNKSPSKTRSDGGTGKDGSGDRSGSEETKKERNDEPQETQVSTFIGEPTLGYFSDSENQQGLERDLNDLDKVLSTTSHALKKTGKALYTVLDDYLEGKPWSIKKMTSLEGEISSLVEDFKKYETKFKTADIGMREDTWLSFPRTWSRTSATFGVPYNTRSLKSMTPLEYLSNYVTISEARRHLYSLVFHRYRMMENPTGKHIMLKSVQSCITEVLGRPFSKQEMRELCSKYLGVDDLLTPILEVYFQGIGAFCERIYAHYSLEIQKELNICTQANRQVSRTYSDNNLEDVDLAYLSQKTRDGQVEPHLCNLLNALFHRNQRKLT